MNTYAVVGPDGFRFIRESGKWDACNRARSITKQRDFIDLTDVSAVCAEQPGAVTLRYLSDGATYSAVLVNQPTA